VSFKSGTRVYWAQVLAVLVSQPLELKAWISEFGTLRIDLRMRCPNLRIASWVADGMEE